MPNAPAARHSTKRNHEMRGSNRSSGLKHSQRPIGHLETAIYRKLTDDLSQHDIDCHELFKPSNHFDLYT